MAIKIETFNKDLHAESVILLSKNNYFYPEKIKTHHISNGSVLFIDDKLVGWASWNEYSSKKADKNKSHLEFILIDVYHDRKGYGTLLLQEFIKWSRDNGKTQLSANVENDATNLESFYKKNGFKKKHQRFQYNQWVKFIRNRKSKIN